MHNADEYYEKAGDSSMSVNVITSSLNALRGKLNPIYPTTPIYINKTPDNFKRPSFFLKLTKLQIQHSARWTVTNQLSWQLAYFGEKDSVGNTVAFNEYIEVDKLNSLLTDEQVLVGDNITFHLKEFEFKLTNDDVYATILLETQTSKLRPEYENMADIKNTIKEG